MGFRVRICVGHEQQSGLSECNSLLMSQELLASTTERMAKYFCNSSKL